jgi:DNA-binding CsgD family transcriptional regulator
LPTETSIAGFLDQLYNAAVMPAEWPAVVKSFRDLMAEDTGNVMSHMTLVDAQSGKVLQNVIVGADPDLVRLGREYYFSKDVYADVRFHKVKEASRQGQTRTVIRSAEVLPANELHATEFYQDFLKPFGICDMLSASTVADGSRIVNLVANPIGNRQFESRHIDLASHLLPHIQRAIGLSLKLGHADLGRLASTLWTKSALSVMVIQQGKLLSANRTAESLLSGSSIIRRSGRSLVFADENANDALTLLTSGRVNLTRSTTANRQAVLILSDSSGEKWLLQLVRISMPRKEYFSLNLIEDSAVLVIMTPLNTASAARTRSLDSIADFTVVERELLYALLDGKTIRQIARATGRSEHTLRWHVRNLLTKTGLRNMTDLVRFASLMLPF